MTSSTSPIEIKLKKSYKTRSGTAHYNLKKPTQKYDVCLTISGYRQHLYVKVYLHYESSSKIPPTYVEYNVEYILLELKINPGSL